jgi:hypothetical protein
VASRRRRTASRSASDGLRASSTIRRCESSYTTRSSTPANQEFENSREGFSRRPL